MVLECLICVVLLLKKDGQKNIYRDLYTRNLAKHCTGPVLFVVTRDRGFGVVLVSEIYNYMIHREITLCFVYKLEISGL